MSYTTSTLVLKIILVVWIVTITRSVLVMIGGGSIFRKANKGEKTARLPIINLFTLLEISDMSSFWGILFFVPIVNMIVLMVMSYKLGTVFNTTEGFKWGLVLLPIVFYPMLFSSDKQYKLGDEAYFKIMDNAHDDTSNLLTQEEINSINNEAPVEPEVEVDSIFKGHQAEIEKVGPYRATRIDVDALNKLKEASAEDDTFAPIKRVDDGKEHKQGGNLGQNNRRY